jgi:hypothetical protein
VSQRRAEAPDTSHRPGQVVAIDGIVFQCDADDTISGLIIRPLQELSQRLRGRTPGDPSRGVPLANHAGIRVRIAGADGHVRRYVVEQLNGTLVQNVTNALSWTPWRAFKEREGRRGWDVTVPATDFEGVEPADVSGAIDSLNRETGRPFFGELCTQFIERTFGARHLFDDVELLDRLIPGPGPRIPEPAAPLLERNAPMSPRARYLLRADQLPSVHSALASARAAPDAVTAGLARRRAVDHLNDPQRRAMRVLFWLVARASRVWALRRPG